MKSDLEQKFPNRFVIEDYFIDLRPTVCWLEPPEEKELKLDKYVDAYPRKVYKLGGNNKRKIIE